MRDTLFVFRPGFTDRGTTNFCPYSAQIIGYLTYYPQVRDSLDFVELGWEKPREPLVSMLGEDHQSAPMLVLAGAPVDVPHVHVREANGKFYVEKTIEILRYLAATRGTPSPH